MAKANQGLLWYPIFLTNFTMTQVIISTDYTHLSTQSPQHVTDLEL